MKKLRCAALIASLVVVLPLALRAQERPPLRVEPLNSGGQLHYDLNTGAASATGGVKVQLGEDVLTARQVTLNQQTGEATAEGDVLLQRGKAVWRGERLRYNFTTRDISSDAFRTGMTPFFVSGESLSGAATNQVHSVTNAFVTTDDFAEPGYRIRAKSLRILPGHYLEARDAVLYLGDTPVFYYPYYRRSLERHPNNWVLTPGYRSRYGPFLLSTYNWHFGTNFDAGLHLDYRQRRGFGLGPTINFDGGELGKANFQYYYAHDDNPAAGGGTNNTTRVDRHRINFSYDATLRTNLTAKVVVREQNDPYIVRDFFESEYRKNIQPSSFLEVNQAWPNFTLDVYAQPRLNDFYETVERLPDVKLTAARQQLGVSPLYYEGETSVGYFKHTFANNYTNDFAAMRADTFHQLLLPYTFFGWLNFTPRVGGRFTHYGDTEGAGTTTTEQNRGVFNTGAELSFKASRVWRGVSSKFWDVNELRHIVQPSVNYAYVPSPNVRPQELPQFDSELSSFRLLPITFPDYNAIDSIDSQNVLRLGLHNKLQTKRADGIENLINWSLYTDWRLKPRAGQSTFADVFSDIDFQPRSWLTLTSETRFDVANERWRLAHHYATIQPGTAWSWSLGHRYLRDDFTSYGQGNNLITSSLYYRVNENWGARISHHFEARDGTLEEQYYTVYRDLRSWTAALSFRVRDSRTGVNDFTVGFTISLKAFPRFGLGRDRNTPAVLFGS
ncbi:MAG: LPS-assembly protein LptD [Verrucomicrobia bacterium]|nr:LPS-assembly protein LptD [Verrucomicrobiota bacterium]